jgi:pantoate--beta-alanine ligase
MTIVLKTIPEILEWKTQIKRSRLDNPTGRNFSVGFVPTMGALHLGHEKLLRLARDENDLTVLSVFVNPTQFNNPDDFKNYPLTWEADLSVAERLGIDMVFAPTKSDLYPDEYKFRVSENSLSLKYCGAHRPGHFDGVLSVLMKLFHVVSPQRAYFGEKDFQQLQLVRGMVDAFFMDLQICSVPTLRETDGLAMSSRNRLLVPSDREKAPLLFKFLSESPSCDHARNLLNSAGFKVDYVEEFNGRRVAAATLGKVRLIDNVKI